MSRLLSIQQWRCFSIFCYTYLTFLFMVLLRKFLSSLNVFKSSEIQLQDSKRRSSSGSHPPGVVVQRAGEIILTLGTRLSFCLYSSRWKRKPCSLSHRPFLPESARQSRCFHSVIVLSMWDILNENRILCLRSPISWFACDRLLDSTGQKDVRHAEVPVPECVCAVCYNGLCITVWRTTFVR